jgi:zinc/manganese transport system permease protein
MSSSVATGLSWNVADDVRQLLSQHFMVNALAAGAIVAVLAGAVGWFMVLRRQSFAGHTLAVISFPGAAGATLLGVSATAGYFAASLAGALVIAAVPGNEGGRTYSNQSAVIGTVQAFALACGVLFVSLYGGFLDSLNGYLFGTFLGVSDQQVLTLLAVAVAVLVGLAAIGRMLLFASVDPDVAATRGVPTRLLSVLFLVLLACAAAEVSQITGALLVFALLVMPAATAQQLTARPAAGLGLSVAIALVTVWLGLGLAYFSVYPVGFYVTTVGFAGYLLAASARALVTWSGTRRAASPAVTR